MESFGWYLSMRLGGRGNSIVRIYQYFFLFSFFFSKSFIYIIVQTLSLSLKCILPFISRNKKRVV